jgi:predicted TIM-barrel fold metal-dependent hydrolase
MVIDGHAHIFPSLHGLNGFRTKEEHMRSTQVHFIAPTQPVIEKATGRVVTEHTLSDGKGMGASNLLDVGFRMAPYGRYEWTRDGKDYGVQVFAPSFPDALPVELMLAQMDFAGVGKAMLHNAHSYGMLNDYIGAAVKEHPHRFRGAAQIHEADCYHESQILELRRAVQELGLTALHFQIEGFYAHDFRDAFDDEICTPFWEEVQRLGIPVLWNIRPTGTPRRENYLEQIVRLGKWARRWPRIPSIFTHGFNIGLLIDDEGYVKIPDELWHTITADNVFVELLFPVMQGSRWEYPFPEAQVLILELHRRIGASKMIWGSDYPSSDRAATYRQSLDYVRRHCMFLSASDKDLILAGNAARLYGFD